jgi:hypothetical protein
MMHEAIDRSDQAQGEFEQARIYDNLEPMAQPEGEYIHH